MKIDVATKITRFGSYPRMTHGRAQYLSNTANELAIRGKRDHSSRYTTSLRSVAPIVRRGWGSFLAFISSLLIFRRMNPWIFDKILLVEVISLGIFIFRKEWRMEHSTPPWNTICIRLAYNLLVWRIGWGKISGVYAFTVVANWSSKELANSAITPGAVDKLPDSFTREIFMRVGPLNPNSFYVQFLFFSLCVYCCWKIIISRCTKILVRTISHFHIKKFLGRKFGETEGDSHRQWWKFNKVKVISIFFIVQNVIIIGNKSSYAKSGLFEHSNR